MVAESQATKWLAFTDFRSATNILKQQKRWPVSPCFQWVDLKNKNFSWTPQSKLIALNGLVESFVSIKRVSELLSLPKFNRETFFGQMSDFVDEENEDLTIGKENY